ncbi:MAG: type II toxin-antitoxin system Phd/YefM family antitoxin [Anaerolineae bacterium]
MVEAVNVHEAKTHFSKLLARVSQGEEITICKAGKPVARLVPIEPRPGKRLLGLAAGQVWMADDFDEMSEEELALFEGSDEE